MDTIYNRLRLLEADHTPDGWPAVQMRDISALLDEVDRLRQSIMDALDPSIESLLLSGNTLSIGLSGGISQIVAASFAEQFRESGAANYLELQFCDRYDTPFLVTIQRRDRPTPHELRVKAEAEVDRLRSAATPASGGKHS